ncbi:MAG: OmpP1/FadL family transporter [Candidatus Latescibacterota bacterium]
MRKVGILFLLAVLGSASGVFASGLAIPEQGAAATGMSAAMTARSEDLSAIFYNAAGLDYVERSEALVGVTPIRPSHTFEGAGKTVDAKKKTFMPPQLYFAHRMGGRLVLGGGIYAPFGLGTDWGKTWDGRYTSTFAEIQAIYVNPTAAYKVTDWLSVGAGFSLVYATATIEKMIDSGLQMYSVTKNGSAIANTANDSQFSLVGEGGGANWNLGLLLRPSSRMQVGVSYRDKTDLEFEGDAEFTHAPQLSAALSTVMPSAQTGKTTLHLPSVLSAGLLYNFTERLDASFDVNFTKWSVYDQLIIELDKEQPAAQIKQNKDWENTMTFRLGSSYDLNELTILRGGLLYDQAPVPDETFDAQLPDNDRLGLSVGFGRKIGIINLDLSYMFLKFSDRDKDNFVGYQDVTKDSEVNATDQATLSALRSGSAYPVGSGSYKSNAHLFSVSASVKF